MVTLAEASVPTRSAGIMSFMNSTRIGWCRDIAPLECMLIAPTQEGSGGALRGLLRVTRIAAAADAQKDHRAGERGGEELCGTWRLQVDDLELSVASDAVRVVRQLWQMGTLPIC